MGSWALRTWLRPAGQPGGLEGATRKGCGVRGEGTRRGRGAGGGQCWRWSPGRRARGTPGRVKMLPAMVSVLGGKHASQGGPLFLMLQALMSFSEFC